MTRRMRSGAVRLVLMSRIWTDPAALTACAYAGAAGASVSASVCLAPSNVAPPTSDSERKASRRFIVLFPVDKRVGLLQSVESSAFHLVGPGRIELVLAQKVLRDVGAQSRGGGRIDAADITFQSADDQVLENRFILFKEFQNQKVRNRKTEVHRSQRAERPIRIVRRDWNVVSVGHGGDFFGLGDAAGARQIRL